MKAPLGCVPSSQSERRRAAPVPAHCPLRCCASSDVIHSLPENGRLRASYPPSEPNKNGNKEKSHQQELNYSAPRTFTDRNGRNLICDTAAVDAFPSLFDTFLNLKMKTKFINGVSSSPSMSLGLLVTEHALQVQPDIPEDCKELARPSDQADQDTRRKAFLWCREFLHGAWKELTEEDFQITVIRSASGSRGSAQPGDPSRPGCSVLLGSLQNLLFF